MSRGTLFIISAPSGTGKTTIMKKIMAVLPGLVFSVSHTTRSPREGERPGIDYHFVSQAEFVRMREEGAFLESAQVHSNFYGTSRRAVEECLSRGEDVFLDIDVQGASQLKKGLTDDAVFVFIAPPSWEELSRRLVERSTDSPETIELRCRNARQEMQSVDLYDYLVVNDRLNEAVDTLRAIIIAERGRRRRSPTGQPLKLFK